RGGTFPAPATAILAVVQAAQTTWGRSTLRVNQLSHHTPFWEPRPSGRGGKTGWPVGQQLVARAAWFVSRCVMVSAAYRWLPCPQSQVCDSATRLHAKKTQRLTCVVLARSSGG